MMCDRAVPSHSSVRSLESQVADLKRQAASMERRLRELEAQAKASRTPPRINIPPMRT